MANSVAFPRKAESQMAHIDSFGLWVICGWTMAISSDKAISYVKNYNGNPNEGFFEHQGRVVLSHGPGKIWLSADEASSIVNLIKKSYL